ncbi:hypothetical protein WJX73_006639 [Symbiochloris irregularis]|uniref:Uncharacterized protein n=1 Tax=Symbiochloris irregularis TaxID=706552 RepID=A0AAW1NR31_9CHLO
MGDTSASLNPVQYQPTLAWQLKDADKLPQHLQMETYMPPALTEDDARVLFDNGAQLVQEHWRSSTRVLTLQTYRVNHEHKRLLAKRLECTLSKDPNRLSVCIYEVFMPMAQICLSGLTTLMKETPGMPWGHKNAASYYHKATPVCKAAPELADQIISLELAMLSICASLASDTSYKSNDAWQEIIKNSFKESLISMVQSDT